MKSRAELLLWAQRVLALQGQPAHKILELSPTCSVVEAQNAFHEIAKIAHPDLHRRSLTPEELETVELAYARAAGAYQELRSQRMQTTRIRPMPKEDALAGLPVSRPWEPEKPKPEPEPPPSAPAATPPKGTPAAGGAAGMNSKATLYYRKAELALRRGDLKTAVLQLKMAIAADPQSAVLRTALAEVQAELAQK